MLIAILYWPADPERGQEVYGPFGTASGRDVWAAEVDAAAVAGDPHLEGVHFILTKMDEPFQVRR